MVPPNGPNEKTENEPERLTGAMAEHDAWDRAGQRRGLYRVMFDRIEDYVRFTDYVYEQLGGRGLELSSDPIQTAVRITQSLLDQTRDRFPMRPVTEADIRRGEKDLAAQPRRGDGILFDSDFEERFSVPSIEPAQSTVDSRS